MSRRVHHGKRDRRVRHLVRRVKHAQLHPRREQPLHRNIELRHADKLVAHRVCQREIRPAAVEIGARHYACRRAACVIGSIVVTVLLREIVNRIAV